MSEARPSIFNETSAGIWDPDTELIARVMTECYGISDGSIASTSIVLDDTNRFLYKGSQKPKWVDRLVRGRRPENQGRGSVVRISTRLRGKERSVDAVNKTLAHELEHVAQTDRNDKNIVLGNIAIWGLAAAGALVGAEMGRNGAGKIVGFFAGAIIGQAAGYKIAPHERQARQKSASVSSRFITQKDQPA